MWLGVLGPVECSVDRTPVEVSGRLNHALLAALAVDERVVGVDELMDALWGDKPPPAAGKIVRNRVSSLRRALAPAFIETVGAGYRLGPRVGLDARDFTSERTTATERLAMWRGSPFDVIAEWPPARAAALRLGELQAHLEEVSIGEALEGGSDPSLLVGRIEELVEREPFREHRWALLMRALQLAGRQHDALRAFQRARRLLRDELGLNPGSELVALERSLLDQAPLERRPARVMPSGTMTFLFTDVEGSTRLWAADRGAMSESLAVHDTVLRGAIEAFGGYVFATAGDSFAAAFSRASDGVRAAIDGQAVLARTSWPGPQLRVRMGLHVGEAEERGGDYFGPAVNTAARVAAAGSGGQVLITDVVRATAAVTDATDLGLHRMRDVSETMRLFQLGDRQFPPLRVVDHGLTNLPARPSRLFGREYDVSRVRQLLLATRLVTVTAVGGFGKTRLAIAVGDAELAHRPAGVWFADLTAVVNGADIPAVIAKAVGLTLREADPTDQVITYLTDKSALVILDNCEHVIDACATFAQRFLRVGGDAAILATSREALDVEGERAIVLGSLSSDSPDSPGVQLFVDRATAVDPRFELTDANATTIAALCARLDGMPLAIELAAARIPVMTPAELLTGLDDRFQLLTGGRRRQRQRTLEATMDWSYDLLEPDERSVLRALGVFVDGFEIDAVAALTKLPRTTAIAVVEDLVAKSLVVRIEGYEPTRFDLLESVKAYAEDRLVDSGEAAAVRDAHLEHFQRLACTHGRTVFGEIRLGARLQRERSNLTSAFEWGASRGRWIEIGELLVGGHSAYVFDGALLELAALVERAIERCDTVDPALAAYLRAISLPTRSWLGDHQGYRHIARDLTTSDIPGVRVFASTMLGYIEASRDGHQARAHLAEARAELQSGQLSSEDLNAAIAGGIMAYIPAVLAAQDGDASSALRHAQLALDVERSTDYRTVMLLSATQLAAACDIVLGQPARALERLSELDKLNLEFFTGEEVRALSYLALGQHDDAQRLIKKHAKQAASGQISGQASDSVLLLAALADAQGDTQIARHLLLHMGVGHHAATRMFSADLAVRLAVAARHADGVRQALGLGEHDHDGPIGSNTVITTLRRELVRRGWH